MTEFTNLTDAMAFLAQQEPEHGKRLAVVAPYDGSFDEERRCFVGEPVIGSYTNIYHGTLCPRLSSRGLATFGWANKKIKSHWSLGSGSMAVID